MNSIDAQISVFSKFFHYIVVKGWVSCSRGTVFRVQIVSDITGRLSSIAKLNLPTENAGMIDRFGEDSAFEIHILRDSDLPLPDKLDILFESDSGEKNIINFKNSYDKFYGESSTNKLWMYFLRQVNSISDCKLLELGGRDRSGTDTSTSIFGNIDVTVLDILESENVDVVGDAHEMKNIFETCVFDAISSVSVFEHLAMPWKAALGMNWVLRNGGIAFVQSHQTVGMHDVPWDFWRFSDSAWESLFNRRTGFEIIGKALACPQFILPVHTWPPAADAEKVRGYLASAVIVRKISQVDDLAWNVKVDDFLESMYPQ